MNIFIYFLFNFEINFFLNSFTKIFDFRIMKKIILVNGRNVWVEEADFDDVKEMFKENVTVWKNGKLKYDLFYTLVFFNKC